MPSPAEEVLEVVVVELRESRTVVDGIPDDHQRGKREVVLTNYLRQLGELTAIDALLRPSELVADRHGCRGRVVNEQLPLHLLGKGGTEVDAHRALRGG